MGLFDWLFTEDKKERRKRVFISFAIEDIKYRDYLVGQARKEKSQSIFTAKAEKIFYTAVAIYGMVFLGIQLTRFIIQNL